MQQEALNEQVVELLLQSLEHEKGGVQVHVTTAIGTAKAEQSAEKGR